MASARSSPPPQLPLDVWLLVFAEIHDLTFLWSACRGVSRFVRACVDELFRHQVIRNTFVDLHYSDIHSHRGPLNSYIHIPMVFDRMSDDGIHAVFRPAAYKEIDGAHQRGSVRGWVPFVERHHKETHRARPKILHKGNTSDALPLWERQHTHWRNTLVGEKKQSYLYNLGNMTSIGRGDRPPFYIKVFEDANDTDLAGLVVDCKKNEVSFDWRETYSFFFREQNFAARAYNHPGKKRVYGEDLVAVSSRYDFHQNRHNHHVRARQKRLKTWTAQNKHRMSPELRLLTEHRALAEKVRVQRFLRHDNLDLAPGEDANATEEIVPERLAKDYAALLFWPWSDDDGFYIPGRRPMSKLNCCIVL
ncbi:hypothetical protein K505DRAFT_321079 [Melanomma pulvis-pyrius CBS 109.77]|uniref:F-box domain-containing protein n=1 Tax=Melanomma pulvis-pyrius CBS 109.77 TaxID=1314802 RepID=A0A6A6XTP5_9PLEO|nr:hypothetical protein K505DRAFT_321079 [Melanomma pulvis-pyrius CBS 109.77]